jgi:hypothetical protein
LSPELFLLRDLQPLNGSPDEVTRILTQRTAKSMLLIT